MGRGGRGRKHHKQRHQAARGPFFKPSFVENPWAMLEKGAREGKIEGAEDKKFTTAPNAMRPPAPSPASEVEAEKDDDEISLGDEL